MRLSSPKSNDDPGGNEPRFHDDQPHRPIVRITNRKMEMVQLTPHLSYPAAVSAEILPKIRALLGGKTFSIGNNGNSRYVAIDGGMLRHETDDVVHAFPIVLAPPSNAGEIEGKVRDALQKLASDTPVIAMHGFVPDAGREIYEMVTAEARRKYAQQRGVIDTLPTDPSVELPHENPPGHEQQGKIGRDGVGAETSRA